MPTHGSLAKAGKVRSCNTPREWRVVNNKKRRKRKHLDPMRRNRRNYRVRVLNRQLYPIRSPSPL